MSITINSNLAATKSSLNLKRASDRLSKSLQRLSSGNRIINASDDAGGLAVAMKLQSSLRRATASMQNTQNGKSFLQMQDSVLAVAGEIVDRMAELKSFYNDISKNDLDRETYNHEFHELQKELQSLRSQKFNGVSLFASVTPDKNNLKIITSDDGLGEHIEIGRIGLFENLKSKFGADGVLNSGSHGEYRQLVGEFSTDGGILDANPGFATRNYSTGQVVFRRGPTPDDSGYFMAVKDVVSGAKIEDTGDVMSNWIRVADVNGAGFSEAYPDAPSYNHNNLKFDSRGDAKAYLKGDILKVQAHWNDPNSAVYIKALADVPRGITLNKILLEGMGDGKYFEFVGSNSPLSSDTSVIKPTTSYVRPNKNHETPEEMVSGNTSLLRSMVSLNAGNSYTPTFAQVGSGETASIYTPTTNWGIKQWNNGEFSYGDLVYNSDAADGSTEFLYSISQDVLGQYLGSSYDNGKFVQSDGKWFQAVGDIPESFKPDAAPISDAADFNLANNYKSGDIVIHDDGTTKTRYVATEKLTGLEVVDVNSSLPVADKLKEGDLIRFSSTNSWEAITSDFTNNIPSTDDTGFDIATFVAGDVYYDANSQTYKTSDGTVNTSNHTVSTISEIQAHISAATTGGALNGFQDVTSSVNLGAAGSHSEYWAKWEEITDPINNTSFASGVTSSFADLDNEDYWTKTHFGALAGKTIGTDYTRGDNIYHQGKHYVYVSHLDSSDPVFTAGSGQDGVTGFDQLVMQGAVVELSMHVDTIGGGGSPDLAEGVYYRPNQDLEFIDRLPDSGVVRTNSIERRTDPTLNADGIYNTSDDLFYGGLNPGNDGIYGTMDDYYTTTAFSEVAKQGGHVDSDADNNKDLLDTTNGLGDFSVADFVDYIQTIANFRAVNGGTMSRLDYATRMLEENRINLESAHGRIMDADIATEAAKMAQQNVLMQAGAAMVSQANQMNQIVLQLLQ